MVSFARLQDTKYIDKFTKEYFYLNRSMWNRAVFFSKTGRG